MKLICIEEHAVDQAIAQAARPVLQRNAFLDDPMYAPVLDKPNDLAVPVYLHPFYPLPQVQQPYYADLRPEVSAQFAARRLGLAPWGRRTRAAADFFGGV